MNLRSTPLAALVALAASLSACSGTVVGGDTPGGQGIVVDLQPRAPQVQPGGTVSFTGVVTGTADTGVVWAVEEVGGGTIDAAGRYTAPAATGLYHVRASSHADLSVQAVAAVTVTPTPSVTVAVSPVSTSVTAGGSATFSAVVTGSTDTAVTWSVQETTGCGSITQAGVYTAPAGVATCHVAATSRADATKTGVATVTVISAGAVARPSWNTGIGFFTLNGKLYDTNGVEFFPMGFNAAHFDSSWASCATNCGFSNAGANAMRVFVWDFSWPGVTENFMNTLRNQQIVAIPAATGYTNNGSGSQITGDTSSAHLQQVVDIWIAWYSKFKPYERYMILDIANEWGPWAGDNYGGTGSTVWRDTYAGTEANNFTDGAVYRLRGAGCPGGVPGAAPGCGYLATIMIDCGDWGVQWGDIVQYAQYIHDHDPQHNVIFSWHGYGRTPTGPAGITTALNAIAAARTATAGSYGGFPVVMGEFGPAGFNGGTATALQAITAAASANVGWLAWAWDDQASFAAIPSSWSNGQFNLNGQGQPASGSYPNNTDLTASSGTGLTDPYGNSVVLAPTYGLFNVRPAKATIFP